jgi:hypothetical protein
MEAELMDLQERELAATRLRQIADEVGLELSPERCERMLGMLEATVDGTRAAAELGLDESSPAFLPDLGGDDQS